MDGPIRWSFFADEDALFEAQVVQGPAVPSHSSALFAVDLLTSARYRNVLHISDLFLRQYTIREDSEDTTCLVPQ